MKYMRFSNDYQSGSNKKHLLLLLFFVLLNFVLFFVVFFFFSFYFADVLKNLFGEKIMNGTEGKRR